MRHTAALKAAETRRRRARGEPDPPRQVKRSAFPAHLWRAPDGRVAVVTSYRPALVARVRGACPSAWWCVGLGAWLVDAKEARAALTLVQEFYEHVTIDTSVAGLLGWIVFPPQGPDGEEVAA